MSGWAGRTPSPDEMRGILEAYLSGAELQAGSQLYQVGPLGTRHDVTTVAVPPKGDVLIATGCFVGTLAELLALSRKTHTARSQARREYAALAAFVRALPRPKAVAK